MNRSTFGDAAASRRATLAHDMDGDDDDEQEVRVFRGTVEGEEEDGLTREEVSS